MDSANIYNKGILLLNKNGYKVVYIQNYLIVYNKINSSPEGVVIEGLEITSIITQLEGILGEDETMAKSKITLIIEKALPIKIRFNQGTQYIEFLPV